MELTKSTLSQRVIRTTASQLKYYYDDFHVSPLMVCDKKLFKNFCYIFFLCQIRLSFSQGGSLGGDKKHKNDQGGINIHSEFLNIILKSVGVTLTEIQDIVFK